MKNSSLHLSTGPKLHSNTQRKAATTPTVALAALLLLLLATIHLVLHSGCIGNNCHLTITNSSSSLAMSSGAATTTANAFSLVVSIQFQDASSKQEFLTLIRPLMDYIRESEPTTIGYEVLLSDKDDLHALLLERYVDREDAYLTIHKSSPPFLAFRSQLQDLQEAGRVTITGHSYSDAGLGFVGRRPPPPI